MKRVHGMKAYWAKRSWEQLGKGGRRTRVIEEQDGKCLICDISEWMGKPLVLEVDHIDGDNTNDSRDNMRGLCGNCHRQTPTYGFGKRGRTNLTNAGWFKSGDDRSNPAAISRPNRV